MTDIAAGTSTVIGRNIHVRGEITGDASIEVWGKVTGETETSGLCWVREGGEVEGEIRATNVAVEGRLEGRIDAGERVELRAASRVKGDITAKSLAIADGAFFQGQVRMRDGGEEPRQMRFPEKRGRPTA
jgi:cytoskeletal protein CcmA (bactofilin family)